MRKSLGVALALLVATAASFAVDESMVAKKIDLKDGSTLYFFKDGKMSMEDKLGRTMAMKHGVVMETKDGQRLIMIGNEVARLERLKAEERGGK